MTAVTAEGKTYELKRRMTTFEIRQLGKIGSKFANLETTMQDDPDKATQIIMSITPEEDTFMDEIIANCLGVQKEQVPKEFEFMHELALFAEIIKVSVPQKNLPSPSAKPTTGMTLAESPTFQKQ